MRYLQLRFKPPRVVVEGAGKNAPAAGSEMNNTGDYTKKNNPQDEDDGQRTKPPSFLEKIGIELDHKCRITKIFKNTPAARRHLRAGDELMGLSHGYKDNFVLDFFSIKEMLDNAEHEQKKIDFLFFRGDKGYAPWTRAWGVNCDKEHCSPLFVLAKRAGLALKKVERKERAVEDVDGKTGEPGGIENLDGTGNPVDVEDVDDEGSIDKLSSSSYSSNLIPTEEVQRRRLLRLSRPIWIFAHEREEKEKLRKDKTSGRGGGSVAKKAGTTPADETKTQTGSWARTSSRRQADLDEHVNNELPEDDFNLMSKNANFLDAFPGLEKALEKRFEQMTALSDSDHEEQARLLEKRILAGDEQDEEIDENDGAGESPATSPADHFSALQARKGEKGAGKSKTKDSVALGLENNTNELLTKVLDEGADEGKAEDSEGEEIRQLTEDMMPFEENAAERQALREKIKEKQAELQEQIQELNYFERQKTNFEVLKLKPQAKDFAKKAEKARKKVLKLELKVGILVSDLDALRRGLLEKQLELQEQQTEYAENYEYAVDEKTGEFLAQEPAEPKSDMDIALLLSLDDLGGAESVKTWERMKIAERARKRKQKRDVVESRVKFFEKAKKLQNMLEEARQLILQRTDLTEEAREKLLLQKDEEIFDLEQKIFEEVRSREDLSGFMEGALLLTLQDVADKSNDPGLVRRLERERIDKEILEAEQGYKEEPPYNAQDEELTASQKMRILKAERKKRQTPTKQAKKLLRDGKKEMSKFFDLEKDPVKRMVNEMGLRNLKLTREEKYQQRKQDRREKEKMYGEIRANMKALNKEADFFTGIFANTVKQNIMDPVAKVAKPYVRKATRTVAKSRLNSLARRYADIQILDENAGKRKPKVWKGPYGRIKSPEPNKKGAYGNLQEKKKSPKR
ncbi:unnamed protein product [Amoebophrya sp. A120]|nr:unnamed protein product [Amoebophrya sp. A120]|eukprot:GSA120T00017007001.1